MAKRRVCSWSILSPPSGARRPESASCGAPSGGACSCPGMAGRPPRSISAICASASARVAARDTSAPFIGGGYRQCQIYDLWVGSKAAMWPPSLRRHYCRPWKSICSYPPLRQAMPRASPIRFANKDAKNPLLSPCPRLIIASPPCGRLVGPGRSSSLRSFFSVEKKSKQDYFLKR